MALDTIPKKVLLYFSTKFLWSLRQERVNVGFLCRLLPRTKASFVKSEHHRHRLTVARQILAEPVASFPSLTSSVFDRTRKKSSAELKTCQVFRWFLFINIYSSYVENQNGKLNYSMSRWLKSPFRNSFVLSWLVFYCYSSNYPEEHPCCHLKLWLVSFENYTLGGVFEKKYLFREKINSFPPSAAQSGGSTRKPGVASFSLHRFH